MTCSGGKYKVLYLQTDRWVLGSRYLYRIERENSSSTLTPQNSKHLNYAGQRSIDAVCVPLKNLSARNDLSAHRNAQNDRSKSRIFNHEQFKTSHIQQSFKKPCFYYYYYYYFGVQMTYSVNWFFCFVFYQISSLNENEQKFRLGKYLKYFCKEIVVFHIVQIRSTFRLFAPAGIHSYES